MILERENIGDYVKIIERTYKDGEYFDLGVTVFDAQGREIYDAALNLDDESVILDSVSKYVNMNYQNTPDKRHKIEYDESGEIELMFHDESYTPYRGIDETADYFGNDWASMTYYHHANPMIPQ